jgi:hypothetical protein
MYSAHRPRGRESALPIKAGGPLGLYMDGSTMGGVPNRRAGPSTARFGGTTLGSSTYEHFTDEVDRAIEHVRRETLVPA